MTHFGASSLKLWLQLFKHRIKRWCFLINRYRVFSIIIIKCEIDFISVINKCFSYFIFASNFVSISTNWKNRKLWLHLLLTVVKPHPLVFYFCNLVWLDIHQNLHKVVDDNLLLLELSLWLWKHKLLQYAYFLRTDNKIRYTLDLLRTQIIYPFFISPLII